MVNIKIEFSEEKYLLDTWSLLLGMQRLHLAHSVFYWVSYSHKPPLRQVELKKSFPLPAEHIDMYTHVWLV